MRRGLAWVVGVWLRALLFLVLGLCGVAGAQAQAAPPAVQQPKAATPRIACVRPRQVPETDRSWYLHATTGTIVPISADKNGDTFFGFDTKNLVVVTFEPDHPSCSKGAKAASAAPGVTLPVKKDAPDARVQAERKEAQRKEAERKEAERKKAEQEKSRREKARRDREAEMMQQLSLPRAQPKLLASATNAPALGVSASACGPPPAPLSRATDPTQMPVRVPILHELLAFENAGTDEAKKPLRESLRALFEGIDRSAAERFEKMLRKTDNTLAVTFRRALASDPLEQELLRVLEGKYKCSPGARSVEPSRLPPPGSLTLSALKLTDEAAFDEIFKRIEQEINGLDAAARGSVAPVTYAAWFRGTDPALRAHLKIARDAKMFAFQKPSREARTAAFGAIGGDIMGLLIELQLMKLYVNILLYEDWSRSALPMGTNANARAAWEDDPAIKRLMKAAGRGVRQEIEAALPEGIKRFDYHNAWVDKQIIAVEHNASLAKQVVQYLDIVMIAISIIEVIRAPVLKPSDVAGPPTITGLLPGGVAIGSRFAATDVSSVLASIQKLIEIGALDKGVIGTVGLLSGSGSVSLPQFQRPTGLSMSSPVKPPVQPTGQSSGKPASKASSGLGSKSSSGPSTQTTKPRGGAPGTRPSEPFTKAGKEEVWNRNAVKHGGTNKCDNCGVDAVRPQQHTRGVKPPGNEGHVDHATARSKGGSGTPDNGQVLCRECNLEKGNK